MELSTDKYVHFFIIFVYGALFGSFFNVCIYRIPRGISLITPSSHCPACKRSIPWFLNIPLVAYLVLGGKCRFCKNKISLVYPLIELISAFIALGAAFYFRKEPLNIFITGTIIYFIFISSLLVLSLIDYRFLIIPDRYTIGGIFFGLLVSFFFPWIHHFDLASDGLIYSFFSAIICFSSLFSVRFLGNLFYGRESIGFGDVKLVAAFGAFMGWQAGLLSIFFAAMIGSFAGIISIIVHKNRLRSEIPFGPFLSLGAFFALFWGKDFLIWYKTLFVY